MLIFSLVRLGNGYASGRLFYVQASMYHPRHTYYITVLVFVCSYVRTTLAIADVLEKLSVIVIQELLNELEDENKSTYEYLSISGS